MDIREAVAAEHAAVGELTAAAYDGLVSTSYLDTLRDAARRAEHSELLVAVDGEQLLGTVTLVPPTAAERWRETDRPEVGTIRMLAVSPAARRRGVGRALAQACVHRAAAHGWSGLVLLSGENMPEAQELYRSMGFRRDEALDQWTDSGLHLMGYALPFDRI